MPRKSVVRLTDRLDMAIFVDWDVKQKQQANEMFNRCDLRIIIIMVLPWHYHLYFAYSETGSRT